jgi:uncharacterized OB-fold protein
MTDHSHDFDYCCRACGSVVYGGDNYCVVCGEQMTEENTVVKVDGIIMEAFEARALGVDC